MNPAMLDLRAFADFGRGRALFPAQQGCWNQMGTGAQGIIVEQKQCFDRTVPSVPAVPGLTDREAEKSSWMAFFDERAGIREFDGGLDRAEAERLAHADTVAVLGPEPWAR